MKSVAIITARGGSKRIPNKNIKDFCGKPIIAYSIEAAIEAGIFDEVMVSTDSEEIAEISERYGAKVPFMRSDATSNDYAGTADVILEVLNAYESLGELYDVFACIYPTAPFITSGKLADAFLLFEDKGADAVISITKFEYPPQRAFIVESGVVKYQYPQFEKSRSQELEPVYHDCGQFYVCSVYEFKKHHSLILPKTIPFIIPEEEVQDIDTLSDWKVAEAKYKALNGK